MRQGLVATRALGASVFELLDNVRVEVQACDGPLLLDRRAKRIGEEGEEYVERYPAFETVDPFEGIYVRRLKIRNETGHTVRLNRIDAVLVDAAGNDNELMTKSALRQDLLARRSCPSTEGVIESLRSVGLALATMVL